MGRQPEVTDDEFLRRLALSADPILFTKDFVEMFDYSAQNVNKRLKSLESESLVQSRKAGSVRVWWLTRAGRERVEERYFSQEDASGNR